VVCGVGGGRYVDVARRVGVHLQRLEDERLLHSQVQLLACTQPLLGRLSSALQQGLVAGQASGGERL
jgi:hypothetical protein